LIIDVVTGETVGGYKCYHNTGGTTFTQAKDAFCLGRPVFFRFSSTNEMWRVLSYKDSPDYQLLGLFCDGTMIPQGADEPIEMMWLDDF
jgi:hypothetical protein